MRARRGVTKREKNFLEIHTLSERHYLSLHSFVLGLPWRAFRRFPSEVRKVPRIIFHMQYRVHGLLSNLFKGDNRMSQYTTVSRRRSTEGARNQVQSIQVSSAKLNSIKCRLMSMDICPVLSQRNARHAASLDTIASGSVSSDI